jgi:hypothetical protein
MNGKQLRRAYWRAARQLRREYWRAARQRRRDIVRFVWLKAVRNA